MGGQRKSSAFERIRCFSESLKIRLDCTVSSFIIYHNITPSDVSIARTSSPASSFFYSHLKKAAHTLKEPTINFDRALIASVRDIRPLAAVWERASAAPRIPTRRAWTFFFGNFTKGANASRQSSRKDARQDCNSSSISSVADSAAVIAPYSGPDETAQSTYAALKIVATSSIVLPPASSAAFIAWVCFSS